MIYLKFINNETSLAQLQRDGENIKGKLQTFTQNDYSYQQPSYTHNLLNSNFVH